MRHTQPQTPPGQLWDSIQSWLFPLLEDEIGALDDKHRQFVAVCELCVPQDHMAAYRWCGNGCPPSDRLAQMTAGRVTSLYDLADAAYDAVEIREMSASLGHVALIDHNPRRGEKREFAPAEAVRYRERSASERVNGHLHDEHGGRHVRVRGPAKVAAHLVFGLMVIAAEQILRLIV